MSVVLITGCSSGFGLEAALAFARRGDRVFATMRDTTRGGDLEAAATQENLEVELVALDVTDDDSVRQGVDRILDAAGGIDVLVNNAGIGFNFAVETMPDHLMRQVFETNVFGVVRMLRAVLPSMRERGVGAVVNVSSVAGRVVGPFNGFYPASKHALEAITESLAMEVAPFGIRVHLVEPGFFRTAIAAKGVAAVGERPPSPYAVHEAAADRYYDEQVSSGGDASAVADAIVVAATSEPPLLRHLVGADAELWVETRKSLDDQGWADLCAQTIAPYVAQVEGAQAAPPA